MPIRQRQLKYVFAGVGVIVAAFIALRTHVLFIWGFPIYCIGCILLASPFFYPAFFGSKRDYLRLIGFPLLATIITAGLMLFSCQINPISGMEGLKDILLGIEILFLAPIVVLVTTAFCCRMEDGLKTAVPWMVFGAYALLATCVVSTVKANFSDFLFVFFGIIAMALVLPLTVTMTVRILFFKRHETADGTSDNGEIDHGSCPSAPASPLTQDPRMAQRSTPTGTAQTGGNER